jgi:GGDEF domain-containing protein
VKRHRVLDEFRALARSLGETTLDEALKAFSELARKLSLEEDDARIYIEELIRSGDLRIRKP